MKKVLIFFVLISFIICLTPEEEEKIILQQRLQENKQLKKCILQNERTSISLKKLLKKTKPSHMLLALHPRKHKFKDSDIEIIKNCRREFIQKKLEEIKKNEQEDRHHINDDNL